MTCVTTGGTSYGYSYDGDGRRVSSDTRNGCGGTPQASAITRYAWDELSAYGDVVAELNSTNTTATMLYIVGDGTVLAQQAGTSATPRFLLHDGQGNTRSLFDNGGTLLENYVYDAFGTLKAPTGTPQTRYLYTGQQFDAATKLYSLRARSYNPAQGRFTSRDTAGINLQGPIELNRYAYTANNPINRVDPTGHVALIEILTNITENIKKGVTPALYIGSTTAGRIAGPFYAIFGRYIRNYLGEVMNLTEEEQESFTIAVTELDGELKLALNTGAPQRVINKLVELYGRTNVYVGAQGTHAERVLYGVISRIAGERGVPVSRLIQAIGVGNSNGPCTQGANCTAFFEKLVEDGQEIALYWLGWDKLIKG